MKGRTKYNKKYADSTLLRFNKIDLIKIARNLEEENYNLKHPVIVKSRIEQVKDNLSVMQLAKMLYLVTRNDCCWCPFCNDAYGTCVSRPFNCSKCSEWVDYLKGGTENDNSSGL